VGPEFGIADSALERKKERKKEGGYGVAPGSYTQKKH
jgi:hypothetical protein